MDNDYYYDITNEIVYQKLSGIWIEQAPYSVTYRIGRINKVDFSFVNFKILPQSYSDNPTGPPLPLYSYSKFVCDENYFFLLGSQSSIDRDFVLRVAKSGSAYSKVNLEQNIVGAPTPSAIDSTHTSDIATNGNGNVYVTYWERWVGPGGALGTLHIASAILRLSSGLSVSAVIDSSQDSFVLTGGPYFAVNKHTFSKLTVSNDFLYVFCHYNTTKIYEPPYPSFQAEYSIFDIITNTSLYNANNIESQLIRTGVAVDWVSADNVEAYYGRFERPDTPVLNTATAGNGQVTLNWNFVAEATGYKIKYGQSSKNYTESTIIATETTKTISGLTNGVTYYFVIVALDNTTGGQSFNSNELSATPISA